MAEVVWTDEAKLWLREIFEYIAADHPDNAARVVERIPRRWALGVRPSAT